MFAHITEQGLEFPFLSCLLLCSEMSMAWLPLARGKRAKNAKATILEWKWDFCLLDFDSICWQNCSKNGFKFLLWAILRQKSLEVSESPGKPGVKAGRSWPSKTDGKILEEEPDTRKDPLQSSWWWCVVHYILQRTYLGGSLGCCWVCSAPSYCRATCTKQSMWGDLSPKATQDTNHSKSLHYMI